MNKPQRESIGRVEWEILQFVADNHPISVREVADQMAKTSGQARTTVLTVLERLRAKGYLTRTKIEGVNQYSPMTSKSQLTREMVGDFVNGMLGGSVSPFFAYLTESGDLSESQIQELKDILRDLEESDAPTTAAARKKPRK